MSYFADLTPYTYGQTKFLTLLEYVNVGWLEQGKSFECFKPEEQDTKYLVISKLKEIKSLSETTQHELRGTMNHYMGGICCSFCPNSRGFSGVAYSSSEIHIHGNGKIYCSPTSIDHYMEIHNYRPPQEYIDAVLLCDPIVIGKANVILMQLHETYYKVFHKIAFDEKIVELTYDDVVKTIADIITNYFDVIGEVRNALDFVDIDLIKKAYAK